MATGCIGCPPTPWALIIVFVTLTIGLAACGYFLNKKAVNIAFLSIGVDYFQVLAMFSRTSVPWPQGLLVRTLVYVCE